MWNGGIIARGRRFWRWVRFVLLSALLVPGNSDSIVWGITLLNCADFARGVQHSTIDDTLGKGYQTVVQ